MPIPKLWYLLLGKGPGKIPSRGTSPPVRSFPQGPGWCTAKNTTSNGENDEGPYKRPAGNCVPLPTLYRYRPTSTAPSPPSKTPVAPRPQCTPQVICCQSPSSAPSHRRSTGPRHHCALRLPIYYWSSPVSTPVGVPISVCCPGGTDCGESFHLLLCCGRTTVA